MREKLFLERAPTLSDWNMMVNDVCRKMFLINNDNIWTLPNGVKFYLPMYPWDHIKKDIVNRQNFYESKILNTLQQYIPQKAVILDIGANIGSHSLFWACIMGAEKIHCFEPIQETYRILLKNIEINRLEKVIIPHNVGLGDKSSCGEILVQNPHNIGGTSIQELSETNAYSFRIERLDDIDLGESKIDFCKIDVEGFELKTLAGMKKTLQKYTPTIFVESFDESIPGFTLPKHTEFNAKAVKEFLCKELGYKQPLYFADYNWLFIHPKTTSKFYSVMACCQGKP